MTIDDSIAFQELRSQLYAADYCPARAQAKRELRAIAVDGKALKNSARLDVKRRHLLWAATQGTMVTLAQAEVGAKTNETKHFRPLLAPLDLADAVVTFDALQSVKANITWLVEAKGAHYIAVIKTNQQFAHAQVSGLLWQAIDVQHTASETGHGRSESRSIKTMVVADNLGGIAFPHAKLAIRIHRRARRPGRRRPARPTTPLPAWTHTRPHPEAVAVFVRGRWGVDNSSHHIRDVTFAEDASTVHTGTAPRAMAAFRNFTIGTLKILGATNIAKTTKAIGVEPERALPTLGISYQPNPELE